MKRPRNPRPKWRPRTLAEAHRLVRHRVDASCDAQALLRRLHMLRVADVMTTSPVKIVPTAPARVAHDLALEQGVRYLLVPLRRRIGAVCLHHIRSASPDTPIADCICDTSWIGPLPPQLSLDDAADVMGERAFRCMPVMAGRLLLGVVTGGDLRRAGIPTERATPRCASCGVRFHVRSGPDSAAPFCLDCLERALPPDEFDEIGVGG